MSCTSTTSSCIGWPRPWWYPLIPGTANLQAYYPLDGSTNDSSGHGYNGTAIGNQTYADAPAGRGKAIQLNGTNDYVDLPTWARWSAR